MRTLVTGVAGFVGRHLAREFAERGLGELHGADRVTPATLQGDLELKPYLASYRAIDIADADLVRSWIAELRPDRIVHLAAQSSGAESILKPAETYRVNVLGALHILESTRLEAKQAAVLLVGSADVYGTGVNGGRIREEAPLRPANSYALSKAAQDALGELYAASYGLHVIRTRTFSHTGPGQRPRFALAGFADQLARIDARGLAPELRVGNLECIRDYSDVRDVVRAYALLLERGVPGETYNICTGEGHRLRELLDRLCAIAGIRPRVTVDPDRVRARDADSLVGDPGKMRTATGWSPEIPIERTLTELYRDARERVLRESGT